MLDVHVLKGRVEQLPFTAGLYIQSELHFPL